MSSQIPTILHFLERVVVQLTLLSECAIHSTGGSVTTRMLVSE